MPTPAARPSGRLPVLLLSLALLSLVRLPAAHAQEPVDEAAIALIRSQGLEHSRVMETLSWLTDVYGPRLTGSPRLDEAARWAVQQLEAWGLQNVHLEPWGPFGRGWSMERFSLHVTSPVTFDVLAFPKAWSPGIDGPVTAEVVVFDADSEEAFADYRGRLAGKIVLIDEPRDPDEPFEPEAERRDAEDLLELANAVSRDVAQRRYSADALRRYRLQQARIRFLYDERPLAILDRSYDRGDYGSVYVAAASVPAPAGSAWNERPTPWDPQGADVIPQITVAAEHYNRIYRLIQKGFPVQVEVDLDVQFHDDDPMEYNVIGEIPGTDPALGEEVVLIGAHLDSWHAGTGATDNGAGSAVMMEAMRILRATFDSLGTEPRRTIRIGLWTGEEQGLYGSVAHVNRHYAVLPGFTEPPTALKPDHARLSAYYNLDNGTGKIRGVYLQGNEAVRPIFAAWLAPFHDLGAATLTISNTGSTDHIPFDLVGLPGFQFIQDPIAYGRTHHSNMDTYDHAEEEDLKQAATIIAAFAYHTAQRDEKLPRKPLKLAEPAEAVGGR